MDMLNSIGSLFGLEITKIKDISNPSAALSVPVEDDGSSIVATSSAAYYGVYIDLENIAKNETAAIKTYRDMALYPEIDIALQDIINEAVPQEDDEPQLKLNLDDLETSDSVKEKMQKEFESVLTLLNYNKLSSDLFKRWYVDGRIFYQIIVDKDNLKRGITELRIIDAMKIKKVKEVKKVRLPSGIDAIQGIEEYFVYNEAGWGASTNQTSSQNNTVQGVKLSPDSIIYAPSGLVDQNSGSVISYMHKAIRPANQLRMLEDALVVYRIARAPERRIFYIDVGTLPKPKAEQYVKDIMNRYRNKMVYDGKTGEVRDDKKYMSMLEDFWMPRREGGKGTEITTLPGAQNLGVMDDVLYFQKKLYQSLNIPASRLTGESGFSIGRSVEISRDEVKFQKFIDRLRRKFAEVFYEALKTQFILRGICNNLEWEDIKEKIKISFQTDNYFSELKEQDVWQSRLQMVQQADMYIGKYFSKEFIMKKFMRMTDEELIEMKEQINNEKDDPTAQPMGMMQPGMDPSMMGGDPGMGGGGFPPQGGGQPGDPNGEYDENQQNGFDEDEDNQNNYR
jgi:hypothetical protein